MPPNDKKIFEIIQETVGGLSETENTYAKIAKFLFDKYRNVPFGQMTYIGQSIHYNNDELRLSINVNSNVVAIADFAEDRVEHTMIAFTESDFFKKIEEKLMSAVSEEGNTEYQQWW